MKKIIFGGLMLSVLTGCVTDAYTNERRMSSTAGGAGIGALGGAAIGALVSKNHGKGALIGAGIGALAGGGVGLYMDNQNTELRNQLQGTGVSVTKNNDKTITLNMPGDVTFESASYVISSNFYNVLDSVATVLKKYDKTNIAVMGHTDSTGNLAANNRLSEQRASAVATHLIAAGIAGRRIQTYGFGPSRPIGDNGTASGRALNRRVEIVLTSAE